MEDIQSKTQELRLESSVNNQESKNPDDLEKDTKSTSQTRKPPPLPTKPNLSNTSLLEKGEEEGAGLKPKPPIPAKPQNKPPLPAKPNMFTSTTSFEASTTTNDAPTTTAGSDDSDSEEDVFVPPSRPPPPVPKSSLTPTPTPTPTPTTTTTTTTTTSISAPNVAPLVKSRDADTLLDGWLEKKGHRRRNWKHRWFVLTSKSLKYYATQSLLDCKGTIDLQVPSDVQVSIPTTLDYKSKTRPFCMKVELISKKTVYIIDCVTKSSRDAWMEALQRLLAN